MHNYADQHGGRFPPAVVYGEDGRPLYSWRVLVLPYLGEEALYQEFRLDEPWDSPHNLALLPRMPVYYAPPPGKRSRMPDYHTVCHVFVGKGAAFEGRQGLRPEHDFPDGGSDTFLVVEAGPPVPWTKPEDLAFDPDGPLPPLTPLFHDGFRATFVAVHRRFIPKETDEETLRALILRDCGKVVSEDRKGVMHAWAGRRPDTKRETGIR